MERKKPVTVYFPGGRASFSPDFILSYGSREKLHESDVLKRIACRGKVLDALWEESAAAAGKEPGKGPEKIG